MDPRELSDRTILEAMRAGHGTATFAVPGLGKLVIEKGRDERPYEFIQRVRSQYGAWYAEQEYKANREARAAQDSRREETHGPTDSPGVLPKVVQATEASLEELMQSKAAALAERYARISRELAMHSGVIEQLGRELSYVVQEQKLVESWLDELSNTPEVSRKVGSDIREEVGHGEPRSGSGVGETGSTVQ